MMKLATLFLCGCLFGMTGCVNADYGGNSTAQGIRGYVVVMSYDGEGVKEGVQGISDSGMRLFGRSRLSKINAGTYDYPADSRRPFPRWVDVTWREGTTPGSRWETGTVVGNYRIDVLSRIPREVFDYAKKHGALRQGNRTFMS